MSALLRDDDLLGLVGLGDEADGHGRHLRLALDGFGERHLIAGAERNLLRGRHAAAGDVEETAAALLQFMRVGERLLEIPAAFEIVGRGEAQAQRHVRRHHLAHRLEHLQRKAHAIGERSAVLVVALVGERREEFVQQVAVGAVDLDRIEPQTHGAFGGLAEGGLHPRETGLVERARRLGARLKRNRGRRVRDPAAVGDLDLRGAFPRRAMRGFAAGMRQLDADRHRRVLAHGLEHAGEPALVLIGP